MADPRLERQLRYYFSDKNLWKDEWLVSQLGADATGFISADVIAGFNRVQQITNDFELVVSSLQRIVELEVSEVQGKVQVRRRYPLAQKPPVESDMPCNETVADEQELQVASTPVPDEPGNLASDETFLTGFRRVPKTGVIFVMDEASKAGYSGLTAHEWANLGQGSPETTRAKNWPTNVRKRLTELVEKGKLTSELGPFQLQALEVNEENLHYGSVNGDWALRRAVARFYNEIYRKGKSSLYSAENVAIVGGGRLALTRLCCAILSIKSAAELAVLASGRISCVPPRCDGQCEFGPLSSGRGLQHSAWTLQQNCACMSIQTVVEAGSCC